MNKSKRSRRARQASPPAPSRAHPEPEQRLLLDQIASGALDPHLTQIAEAINARSLLLQTVASAKALDELTVGDRIRINSQVTPRYLHGIEGTVVDLDEEAPPFACTAPSAA
jgi:hypothetical protein